MITMTENSLLGDAIGHIQESGCSMFFLTSSILSLINGKQNRENSIENALKDEAFQRELQKQKELYEDKKEAEDRAFKLWLKQRQREYARIEMVKKLDNDFMKSDLKMFFKDWPLLISVEAINEKRRRTNNNAPSSLNVIIGKPFIGEANNQLDIIYSKIIDVDEIVIELKKIGFNENDIYRFKPDNTVIGGPALANIFAMMSNIPTIVLLPKIDESMNLFNISIGLWNQDALFPMQNKVLELDFNKTRMVNDREYLQLKKEEIIYSYITIATVMNDTYSLVENCREPYYPKYGEIGTIKKVYPRLIDFAKKEYLSLISTENSIAESTDNQNVFYNIFERNRINELVREAINLLK